jgi:alcohol dehydrogenase class IV
LPAAMEYDFPSCREKLQGLTAIVGPSVAQSRPALSDKLRATFDAAGIPRTLAAAGVSESALHDGRRQVVEWARGSSALVANPRVPSAEELGQLIDAAFTGRPVTF